MSRPSSWYERHRAIQDRAWAERTEEATLALVEDYAASGCATHPRDSELFRERWGEGSPPGYELRPYHHLNTHTVGRAATTNTTTTTNVLPFRRAQ